jgi:hypothetical protein
LAHDLPSNGLKEEEEEEKEEEEKEEEEEVTKISLRHDLRMIGMIEMENTQ